MGQARYRDKSSTVQQESQIIKTSEVFLSCFREQTHLFDEKRLASLKLIQAGSSLAFPVPYILPTPGLYFLVS
jgi:hypothetical protein